MWEFSIQMDSAKRDMAEFIYSSLKIFIDDFEGVITSFEQGGKISIVIACPKIEKSRLQYHVSDCISKAICIYLKSYFLEQKLKIPQKSDIEIYTFKKALVSFDRETDRFLINKYIVLDKNLVIESFFHFKLQPLKEKWEELVRIANDNSTYLLSDDSFVELLKFLVDNIEFSIDEIGVCFSQNKIDIVDFKGNKIVENVNEFSLVDNFLLMSPRKINWDLSKKLPFIEKVFEKRIVYVREDKFKPQNPLQEKISLQT